MKASESKKQEKAVISGSREAVEAAIRRSKGIRSSTWEDVAIRSQGKIKRWEELPYIEEPKKRVNER